VYYILLTLYIIACFVLILFVLLQPSKSDAAAVFGGANSAAFGPRGTQTVLAKVTITAAIVFFLTAFIFSIPGIFEPRSIGEGVNAPAESTQPAPAAPTPTPAPDQQPAAIPPAPLTPAPAANTNGNTNTSAAKPATTPAKPAAAPKNSNAATANANKK
jgi:protein translocase SecG subunit